MQVHVHVCGTWAYSTLLQVQIHALWTVHEAMVTAESHWSEQECMHSWSEGVTETIQSFWQVVCHTLTHGKSGLHAACASRMRAESWIKCSLLWSTRLFELQCCPVSMFNFTVQSCHSKHIATMLPTPMCGACHYSIMYHVVVYHVMLTVIRLILIRTYVRTHERHVMRG